MNWEQQIRSVFQTSTQETVMIGLLVVGGIIKVDEFKYMTENLQDSLTKLG